MRNLITLLTAATIIVACADDPNPTSPASRSNIRSSSGNVQAAADKAPDGQGKPIDPVPFTKVTKVFSSQVSVPAGGSAEVTATCPAGTTAVSGGHFIQVSGVASAWRFTSSLMYGNGWQIGILNNGVGAGGMFVTAIAYCAS